MSRQKLRVIFVMEALYGGGAERTTLNLLRHLDRQRFEPILFLLTQAGVYFSEVPRDVKVVYASKLYEYRKSLMPYYLSRLLAESRRSDILVGALEIRPTYLAYMAGIVSGKPVIGWVRVALDKWLKEWRRWHCSAVRFVYPKLTFVVCVSKAVAQSVKYVTYVNHRNLKVIYNPYEIDTFIEKGREEPPQWYADILDRPTIIAVGRMMNQKGFDILITAHAEILRAGIVHNLVIVGDGPLRRELENLIGCLNVGGSVFMPGYIQNPYALMVNATALVVSSRYEGLSGVAIEALALGTPVVATASEGFVEVLSGGHYGLLVPTDDMEGLKKGIATILTDHALRERLSAIGPERARFFAAAKRVPEWERLLIDATGPSTKSQS